MRISDFVFTQRTGDSVLSFRYYAEVTVSSGFWIFKKTERKRIAKTYIGNWYFVDDGNYLPSSCGVDEMFRAYETQLLMSRAK
jgi:hypothetical protein